MDTVEPDTAQDTAARASVTIGRPAGDLRALWLRPDTQSRIWAHFADVMPEDDRAMTR